MADFVFNQAKGKLARWVEEDATQFEILLLTAAEAQATLQDYDDISTLLAAAGNTEATFTNYARKGTTATDATQAVDDTNNRNNVDMADVVWTSAGGASNNTLVGLIICKVNGAGDANRVPCTYHDFSVTTDGNNLTAAISDFYRAT